MEKLAKNFVTLRDRYLIMWLLGSSNRDRFLSP